MRAMFVKMRKSLGEKRKEISPDQIEEVTASMATFDRERKVKVFPNEEFGYQRITVERPLRLRYTADLRHVNGCSPCQRLDPRLTGKSQDRVLRAFDTLGGLTTLDRSEVLGATGVKLSTSEAKMLWDGDGERRP